jgi:protein N-terminal methyltransferase
MLRFEWYEKSKEYWDN